MAEKMKLGKFWIWVAASLIFRLVLIYFPNNLNLASRPEVSTPITSLRHLAEGNWLKQASLSLYAGSMYHGSLLLLSVLGPLTVKRIEGQPNDILCRIQIDYAHFHERVLSGIKPMLGVEILDAFNSCLSFEL